MIRVIGYASTLGQDAISYYRIVQPLTVLSRYMQEGWRVELRSSFSIDHLENADVMVFQRIDRLAGLAAIRMARARGIRVIIDLDDDLWHVPEWNPAYKYVIDSKIADGVDSAIDMCNAVFVSTDTLGKVVQSKHSAAKVYVLPNCIDPSMVPVRRFNNRRPVAGWAGGDTHQEDLKILWPVVDKIKYKYHVSLFCAIREGCETIPHVPFLSYYSVLSLIDLDVAFAPLQKHVFNDSKSALRFLEYAAAGSPVIASDVAPYRAVIEHGRTGFLARDSDEMLDFARYLLSNPTRCEDMGQAARKSIEQNHSIYNKWVLWRDAILDVLGVKEDKHDG